MEESKSGCRAADTLAQHLIALLEQGVSPWHKPWACAAGGELPLNFSNNRPYRGINALCLGLFSRHDSPAFATLNQINALGGRVKQGEKALPVVFWDKYQPKPKTEADAEGPAEVPDPYWVIKGYKVFNLEQTEGLPEEIVKRYTPPPVEGRPHLERIKEAEAIVAGYADRPDIHHGGSASFYVPSDDYIQLPEMDRFDDAEAYYGTLFHECAHSTGHQKRLGRKLAGIHSRESYSREELVAEIASCLLCQRCGISREGELKNAAAYCEGWAKNLKQTPARSIVQAASAAQNAADYILGLKARN